MLNRPRTISVLTTDGTCIASEPARSKATRISTMGAADQRQLNALHLRHPHATRGAIIFANGHRAHFRFTAPGLSSHVLNAE